MFDDNVKTEAIPERVFELCKMVDNKPIAESDLKEMFEPIALGTNATSYFSTVRGAAEELHLIKKQDGLIEFVGDKTCIKSMEQFRRYCNSVVWKNENTFFYRIAQTLLNSNDTFFGENITSLTVLSKMREAISPSINEPMMLGERFWLAFLGFGFVHEAFQKITFLPNMYIAMKDFISLCDFEKGKDYTVREFLTAICEHSKVAFDGIYETKQFNLAASNALRQLDKSREIKISRNLDSKEVWRLYKLETQNITEITHITIRGIIR